MSEGQGVCVCEGVRVFMNECMCEIDNMLELYDSDYICLYVCYDSIICSSLYYNDEPSTV